MICAVLFIIWYEGYAFACDGNDSDDCNDNKNDKEWWTSEWSDPINVMTMMLMICNYDCDDDDADGRDVDCDDIEWSTTEWSDPINVIPSPLSDLCDKIHHQL